MLRIRILTAASLAALVPGISTTQEVAFPAPSTQTSALPPTDKKIAAVIIEAAREHEVDPIFVECVMNAESEARTEAISHRGAVGLMQVMPATAEELGLDANDWRENLQAGTAYLGILMKKYGDVRLALAAYNAGPGKVNRYRGVPPYPETRAYVRKVMHRYRMRKARIPRPSHRVQELSYTD